MWSNKEVEQLSGLCDVAIVIQWIFLIEKGEREGSRPHLWSISNIFPKLENNETERD